MKIRQSLIIEDSEIFRIQLQSYVKRLPFLKPAIVCETYIEAIDILSREHIDIVFLDIELPDYSGLDLLRSFPNLPPTILTTSHTEYAVESYTIGRAVDYLLKPFDFERFLLAVNRALSIEITQHSLIDLDCIIVKMGRTLQRFELKEIDYIEASTIYSKIVIKGVSYLVNETISSLAERLEPKQFIRVHKSFVINISNVTAINSKSLFIGKHSIPIGKAYKHIFEGFLRFFERNPAMD